MVVYRIRRGTIMSRTGRFIGAFAVLATLAGCSADETDFQKAAEEAAVEAAETANPDFTATATCDEPASTDVGTTFECTVTFNDGVVQPATAEIVSDSEVRVETGS
jgi:hypothetical protein